MAWTRKDTATLLFGLFIGLWGSTWIALIHQFAPFSLSYFFGFWFLWVAGNLRAQRSRCLLAEQGVE